MDKILILFIMTIALSSCSEKTTDPVNWSDREVNEWYEKQEWLGGWEVQPDSSVNRRSLAIQYFKNPTRWDKAFHFLKTADLEHMPPGKQNLEGDNLFISIAEYVPKERELVRYESHQKYIDIQYVIKGEEIMGLTTHDKVAPDEAYNEENDIAFFKYDGGKYISAGQENFLVFFPDDVHRPSISTGDSLTVRKIVVKIRVD